MTAGRVHCADPGLGHDRRVLWHSSGAPHLRKLDAFEAMRLRARNGRLLMLALAIFLVVLVGLRLTHGFHPTAAVVAVAGALTLVLLLRNWPAVRDWSPLLVIGLAYELIRGDGGALLATVHVADMVGFERALFGGVLPTETLQHWLHPAHGLDPVAAGATILYVLHTALPLVVARFLWLRDKRAYYDFVAALVVLSVAAFVTYLILPVAPPWWAALHGYLTGANGQPELAYLKPSAFDSLAGSAGLDGHALFGLTFGDINPDPVASFPSLHAAYPFLAYLSVRRVLGLARWGVLAYAAAVWFAVIYLGDHYVVDVAAGIMYSLAAYALVVSWDRLDAPRVVLTGREDRHERLPAGNLPGSVE